MILINDSAYVQNHYRAILDVSTTDIQEATIDDVADGGVGNWKSLTEPGAVLDYVMQTLGVVVLISSKQTHH